VTWDLVDVVRATGAEVQRRGSASVFTCVATDSRKLAPGALFVALRGERFDAHHFVAEAAGAGAAGVVVERVPSDLEPFEDLTVLVVPDSLRALQDLAADLRRRLAPCVLAVTGSNGKTTTKEMLAAILAAAGGAAGVLKTQVNLNNLIGVPLTLLRLAGGDRHAVIEMGMNAPGEIWRLAEIADPDVGVITNVAPAHLEGLGSLAGVARAKGELFARMRRNAVAIVNADDPHVSALGDDFEGPVVRFAVGDGAAAEVRAEEVRIDEHGNAAFRLHVGGATAPVHLRIAGRHNVGNALAAAAAAHAVGVGVEAITTGLGAALPVGSRMRVRTLANGVTIVDDSYNANPASVAAALRSLREAPARRRLAVLGDMLELGATASDLHRDIGRLAAELGIDALYLFGEHAAATAQSARAAAGDAHASGGTLAPGAVHVLTTHAAIAAAVADVARAGDWVLVKGSRAQRMEEVVRLLGAAE
jgi:UDP-N-acetylmuramoyl-tripeptide--D-alanyl-D-alanine ligase